MPKRHLPLVLAVFVLGVVIGSAQNRIPEGLRPYSPNRIQWLALTMEAQMRVDLSRESGYSLDFVGLEPKNAILIYVRYLPTVDREIMNGRIDTARKIINVAAKSEGWLPWLKIEEDVKIAEEPKR